MSVSELLDNGVPHPWAILREQQLTLDGTLFTSSVSNMPTTFQPVTLNVGSLTTPLYYKGSGTVTSTPTASQPVIYTLNYTTGVNTVTYILFTLVGITTGGSHNNLSGVQTAAYQIQYVGGTFSFIGSSVLPTSQTLTTQGWTAGTIGQRVGNAGNQIFIQAYNTNSGETTEWIYTVEIWSINQ